MRVKETEVARETESSGTEDKAIDRGFGLRRALSDETQSRPFLPLGGEVLHVAAAEREGIQREGSRSEAESDRACLEQLLEHYTVEKDEVEGSLTGSRAGGPDVTLTLGPGALLRYSAIPSLHHAERPGRARRATGAARAALEPPVAEGAVRSAGARVPVRARWCGTTRQPDAPIDDATLWNEPQQVTNAIGWERRAAEAGGQAGETQVGSAQMEAMEAIAEEIKRPESDDDGECSADFESVDESVDEDDTEAVSEAYGEEKTPRANRPANTGPPRDSVLNPVVSSTPAGDSFKNGVTWWRLYPERTPRGGGATLKAATQREERESFSNETDSDSGVVVLARK